MSEEVLKVSGLSYAYQDGGRQNIILKDVDFSFEAGVFYAIVGESGSGKTTFLSLIAGLDSPQEGSIYYRGKDIKAITLNKYRRHYAAMVFQNYNLIPYMNAYDNVLTALSIAHKKVDPKTIRNFLSRFGIDDKMASRKVSKLSGGEQQRVAIARALATDVELIIADEPTGNLDVSNSKEIIAIFKDLAHNYHRTIIMVTHNEKNAMEADQIIRIDRNRHQLVYETSH